MFHLKTLNTFLSFEIKNVSSDKNQPKFKGNQKLYTNIPNE